MNKIKITLNDADTYDVEFYKIPKYTNNIKDLDKFFERLENAKNPVLEFDGLYSDMLVDTFEQTTELYLHF